LFDDLYEKIYQAENSHLDSILDVPFVPTDDRLVRHMLELGGVNEKDLVYDLGCGDGRIVMTAARDYGARGVGIDKDPQRLEEARELAKWNGVRHMLALIEDDLLTVDISKATVVMLYLLPALNLELRPRLLNELQPGTRIVSHDFDMADWQADERVVHDVGTLLLWIVPAKVAGTWEWQAKDGQRYRVALEQEFQKVTGKAWVNDQPAQLHSAQLRGTRLQLAIQGDDAGPLQEFVCKYANGELRPETGSTQFSAGVRVA